MCHRKHHWRSPGIVQSNQVIRLIRRSAPVDCRHEKSSASYRWLFRLLFLCMPLLCSAQKLAITFDDLPQNGELPPGVTRVGITKNTLAILKKLHVPATYGFINAKKLEGSADGAEALKLWAAERPLGNHTYSHLDLNQNTPEAFQREIAENEPVLELLQPSADSMALQRKMTGTGCVTLPARRRHAGET